MKILFLEWNSFGNPFVKKEFEKRGYEIVCFDFPQKSEDTRGSEELASTIASRILEIKPEFVFSFNYFPVAAVASKACKVKYISWTYDSPYIQLYSKTIDYETNYAFVFDKAEYFNLRNKGINTVYYLPMAGAVDTYDEIVVTEKEHQRYDADIAMIGSMYTEAKHRMFRHFANIDEYTKGFLEAIINAQKKIYGASIIESSLTEDIVKRVQKSCPIYARGDGYESAEWVLANYFIAREITSRERAEMIQSLSEKYKVSVYTGGDISAFKNVINKGTVDYYNEAPKAMKCAKINLNISLRSIVTGIPQRAFDIMATGGFLLTNYQADFQDYFEADKDYVYFESVQDLVDKTGYYLEHEDERIAIAQNGYDKVKEYHTYSNRVDEMLRIVNE